MPTLKTTIFNSAIDINYEEGDKDKLLQLIENLNNRLKKYNYLNGKVSDSKIIILASLAIEDDLMEQKKLISKQLASLNKYTAGRKSDRQESYLLIYTD